MLRIRLSRVGKKKQPAYRIVVADSRAPQRGAFVEIIGHYNPLTDPATLVLKEEKAVEWLKKGAQPSESAAKLLTRLGVMEKAGKEPFVHRAGAAPPKPKKRAVEPAAAAPAAATATATAAEQATPEPAEPEVPPEAQDQTQEQAEQAEPTE